MAAHHTLDTFRAHIRGAGLPTASKYQVQFLPNKNYGHDNAFVTAMLADQVSLPGVNIATTEMRTFGEITESAYGVTYQPVNISLIVDNETNAKQFFDDWSNQVFNRRTRNIGYYDDYVRDIRISLLDRKDKPIYTILLKEAYPKTVSDIQLDYSNKEILRLTVLMSYRYWEKELTSGDGLTADQRIAQLEETSRKAAAQLDRAEFDDFQAAAVAAKLTSDLIDDVASCKAAFAAMGISFVNNISSSIADLISGLKEIEMPSTNEFAAAFVNLMSGITEISSSITTTSENISNTTPAATELKNAVTTVSNSLNLINNTVSSFGLGAPFADVIVNLNNLASTVSGVSTLGGLTNNLTALGSNISTIGSVFTTMSYSTQNIPGATSSFGVNLSKLGTVFSIEGSNMVDTTVNVIDYVNGIA